MNTKLTRGIFLPVRIAGIPCTVEIHTAEEHKGSFSYDAPSDLDYHGYWELDYTICDRRGNPANWLESKASPADIAAVEEAIRDFASKEEHDGPERDYDDDY